ncbi:MAG: ABC transporter permease, partial [Clostridia bacterium]|nr:ABC transporter permease [Clostridia bacterium]
EQLLLTSPVSIIGIVSGKFLAAYTVFAACMLLNSLYFFILLGYASLKVAVLFGNLLAILLVGLVYVAIGLFVSSLTENQLSAAVGTMAIIIGFLLVGVVGPLIPSSYAIRYVFDFISIFTRFQAFTAGYLDIAALFYYISVAFVFLYLTVRIYDRRRYS